MEETKARLEGAGFPVAYDHFPADEPQNMPFVCFLEENSNNFFADGTVYHQAARVRTELYTAFRDPVAEHRLEATLDGVCWNRSTEYLDDEQCYLTTYEFEV